MSMQGGLEEVGAILKFELRRLRWIDSSEFNRHLCAMLLSRNATDGARIFRGRAKFHLSRSIPVFRDSRFFNHGWEQMGTDWGAM